MTQPNQPSEASPIDGPAIDKLIAAHRVIGQTRLIRSDTPVDEISDQQCAEVIERVKAYLRESSIPQSRLAKALVIKGSTLSQILSGKYPADVRAHCQAMDRWLERRIQADALPETFTYIETAVAERIILAAKTAMASADAGLDTRISLVWGDPGCGKTLALRAIADKEGGILITCGVEVRSGRTILDKIAESLGMPARHQFTRLLFAEVVKALRGTGKLILVDEIHALLETRDDSAFHTLRRLSDESGVPQLWSATCDPISQLQAREHKREPLGQITRRIGAQFHLTQGIAAGMGGGGKVAPLYSVEEILKIYGRNELKLTRDAARFLARFCTNGRMGLPGRCTALVHCATTMNRQNAKEITMDMLWQAATFLFQPSVVYQISIDMKEELRESRLKIA